MRRRSVRPARPNDRALPVNQELSMPGGVFSHRLAASTVNSTLASKHPPLNKPPANTTQPSMHDCSLLKGSRP
jgi:hypothetical protein